MEPRKWAGWRIPTMVFLLTALLLTSCDKNEEIEDPLPTDPNKGVILLPVVIHVIHEGERVGEGPNLSEERIKRQIEILNEDFRRKKARGDLTTTLMEGMPILSLSLPNGHQMGHLPMESIELIPLRCTFPYWGIAKTILPNMPTGTPVNILTYGPLLYHNQRNVWYWVFQRYRRSIFREYNLHRGQDQMTQRAF